MSKYISHNSLRTLLILISFFSIVYVDVTYAAASVTSNMESGTLHKDGQIRWDGHEFHYYYYEPNDPGTSPRPLVVLLHGGGGNVESFLGLDGKKAPFKIWLDIADEENFYVAIPQARDSVWNDCRDDCSTCGEDDDIGFLNEMINELMNKYLIDSTRIYSTGESNGGHMSYRLAMELSHRIAAVGVVIAGFPAQNECSGPVNPIPVLIMNGTADPICPWEGGQYSPEDRGTALSAYESVDFWVAHNQCDSIPEYYNFPDLTTDDNSTVTLEKHDNGVEGTEIYLYRIDGGGHASPSILEHYADLWLTIVGNQNYDIEMAREVWAFFKRHTLSGKDTISIINKDFIDLPIKSFQLSQNYPNPFGEGHPFRGNPQTTITYQLAVKAKIILKIYDMLGGEVRTLINRDIPAGCHSVVWDGKDNLGNRVSSGVYYYKLKLDNNVSITKKLMLLK